MHSIENNETQSISDENNTLDLYPVQLSLKLFIFQATSRF